MVSIRYILVFRKQEKKYYFVKNNFKRQLKKILNQLGLGYIVKQINSRVLNYQNQHCNLVINHNRINI